MLAPVGCSHVLGSIKGSRQAAEVGCWYYSTRLSYAEVGKQRLMISRAGSDQHRSRPRGRDLLELRSNAPRRGRARLSSRSAWVNRPRRIHSSADRRDGWCHLKKAADLALHARADQDVMRSTPPAAICVWVADHLASVLTRISPRARVSFTTSRVGRTTSRPAPEYRVSRQQLADGAGAGRWVGHQLTAAAGATRETASPSQRDAPAFTRGMPAHAACQCFTPQSRSNLGVCNV